MKLFEPIDVDRAKIFLIQLDPREAKALLLMAEAACEANKRRQSWKRIKKVLEELPIF